METEGCLRKPPLSPCCCSHLQIPAFPWIEHQQLLQQVLTVGGHVEGYAVFPSEDPFSQLLHTQTQRSLFIHFTHTVWFAWQRR